MHTEASVKVATQFYCPNCERSGKRNLLAQEKETGQYMCNYCDEHYTPSSLRDEYQQDYNTLISDAAWIRDSMIARLVGEHGHAA